MFPAWVNALWAVGSSRGPRGGPAAVAVAVVCLLGEGVGRCDDPQAARQERLRADAQALFRPIRAAGGYEAIAERLGPWRKAVRDRIAAIPKARHKDGYIADDAPLDGGEGLLLSGRRARQLLYESDFAGSDAVGDRRYARAERALLRAHRELSSIGLRLVVVVAPDKCDIYPERIAKLPPGVPTVHLRSKQLALRLLHAGVEIIDGEALLQSRKGKESGPIYMLRDTHWSPAGSRLLAGEVAGRLSDLRAPNGRIEERAGQTLRWDGDLATNWTRAGGGAFPPEVHRFVGVAGPRGKPVQPDPCSTVLVLGDSYSTFPYNGHLSFWAFLSQRMGFPVAFSERAGGGNAVLANFRRIPKDRLARLKAVVLLFTSCSFYEVDFSDISLLSAPLPAAPAGNVSVVLLQGCPNLDPAKAPYRHAVAGLRATVDRGDHAPVPMQLYVPVMMDRRLLPASAWKKGQELKLDLFAEEPAGQAGTMTIETDADPDLPAAFVRVDGFPGPSAAGK